MATASSNNNNKARVLTSAIIGSRDLPKVSLNLHTMPQTADSQFKKWLLLGILISGLMILIAVLLVW